MIKYWKFFSESGNKAKMQLPLLFNTVLEVLVSEYDKKKKTGIGRGKKLQLFRQYNFICRKAGTSYREIIRLK